MWLLEYVCIACMCVLCEWIWWQEENLIFDADTNESRLIKSNPSWTANVISVRLWKPASAFQHIKCNRKNYQVITLLCLRSFRCKFAIISIYLCAPFPLATWLNGENTKNASGNIRTRSTKEKCEKGYKFIHSNLSSGNWDIARKEFTSLQFYRFYVSVQTIRMLYIC